MHIIFNNKCQSNPENQVGLILMGGKTFVLPPRSALPVPLTCFQTRSTRDPDPG